MIRDLTIDEKKNLLERDYGIKMTEEMEEEVLGMCDYSVGIYEKGLTQGITQGEENKLLENIKNIMEGLDMPLEKVLDILKVPKSDYEKYKKLIK